MLKQKLAVIQKEYDTGFFVPDIQDVTNTKQLQAWNGDWAYLSTIRFIRIARDGAIYPSKFPPKGGS